MNEAARNAVDRLLSIVPPPRIRFPSGDWARVEAVLGVSVPEDFVELATAWGEGTLVDHVFFSAADRFVERAEQMLAWEREARAAIGFSGPPLWPDPGGLLPWASTGNGDQLWWRTVGASDQWMVSYQQAKSETVIETSWSTAETLLAYVERRSDLLGTFERSLEPWFSAARDVAHFEWGARAAGLDQDESTLVARVATHLPVRSPRGRWAGAGGFQRHWITGENEWRVTLERHGAEFIGLRLTCPIEQDEDARRAAADVAHDLGVVWTERYVSGHVRQPTDGG